MPTHTVLGRGAGLTDEQLQHLADDPLPEGVYADDEAAIVRYAQRSTRLEPIDDETYGALEQHFSREAIIEITLLAGASNMVNRFHATFHTDVDAETDELLGAACPVSMPQRPG